MARAPSACCAVRLSCSNIPHPFSAHLRPSLQGFSVWYEQGRNVSFEDAGPIIGLTAHCTPYLLAGQQPGALVELQVFPGQGPPDFSLNFTSGLPNVTVKYGQFLDSFLGAGGAGTSQVRCRTHCWQRR